MAGGGVGEGGRLILLDLSLILSPFVCCVWGARGRLLPSLLSLALSSQERGPRGGQGRFLFVWIPAFRQASSFLSPPVKTPGLVPHVLSLCLVYYSCLSSRLFQFACHLHTFHFSFLTPAEGQGAGRRGEGRGGRSVTFLSKRCRSRNVGIGVGVVERWSREQSAAPLS